MISIRPLPSLWWHYSGVATCTKWYIYVHITRQTSKMSLLVSGLGTFQEEVCDAAAADPLVNGVTRTSVAMILETLENFSRSNMTWYWTKSDRKKGKATIRLWTHNRHPIPCPYGRAMGHLVLVLRKMLPWDIESTLLTIYDKRVIVLHDDGYPLPVPSQC